jgi:hypothetical protein
MQCIAAVCTAGSALVFDDQATAQACASSARLGTDSLVGDLECILSVYRQAVCHRIFCGVGLIIFGVRMSQSGITYSAQHRASRPH